MKKRRRKDRKKRTKWKDWLAYTIMTIAFWSIVFWALFLYEGPAL